MLHLARAKHLQLFTFFIALFIGVSVQAQTYTISGYVKDVSTGETMIGATVLLKELGKGAVTNTYGFYSVTAEKGTYNVVIGYLGFKDYTQTIVLDKDIRLNVELGTKENTTKEVEIKAEVNDDNVAKTTMGQVKLDIAQIKALPVFMGETDVLKTIQLLPGVKGGAEGNAGFYVRGGGPDQNLILLDEAIVYNAGHLFGFFSVFNGDAIKSVNLIKGGMPAQYGGRLASVLDISMKEGNSKRLQGDGGVGLIASRFTLQGPIVKDKVSFIVSGRRTYADVLARPFINPESPFRNSGYFFYDLNGKLNWTISDKDRVFISGYFGRDVFTFSNTEFGFATRIPWGNATLTARWNHLFNDKLFCNTSLVFSDYRFAFEASQQEFELGLRSGIRDYNAKVDFTWIPNVRHNVKFGVNYIYHRFTPNNASASANGEAFDLGDPETLFAHEVAAYISDDFDVTEKFALNYGVRLSLFQQIGPFTRYVQDEFGSTTDSIKFSRGQAVGKPYFGFEPRLALKYQFTKTFAFKASYTRNFQYLHLASLATVSLPTDLWFPSTSQVQPQIGNQYSVGLFKNFKDNMFEVAVELYYKDMANQVEYEDGYTPGTAINNNLDNFLVFGRGWAYGSEFFIRKNVGKWTGWLGYTLSWTDREFKDINNGKVFPARYDRRHDIQLVNTYEFSPKLVGSLVWVYSTGNAFTLQTGRYFYDGNIVSEFGLRNGYRLRPYHRMDLSLTFYPKKGEQKKERKNPKFDHNWNLSIYNVYSRLNPYFIYFATTGNLAEGNIQLSAREVSLFPIIPAITWNFSF